MSRQVKDRLGLRLRAAAVAAAGGRALILLLALLLPQRAHAAIGAAEAVVNQVAAHLPGQDRALRPEDEVFQDEVIETGEKSASKLLFRDETQLRIGPNSKVALDKFIYSEKTGQQVVVSMAVGVMRFTSGKLIKSAYTISTPTATVGIRGTEFDVIVDENGATTIVVYSGEVLMRSSDGVRTSIGVCGFGMTSPQGETLTMEPQPANRLAPDRVARVLEMDQLLQTGAQTVAAGVGECLDPAGPGDGAPAGEPSAPPAPLAPNPNLVRVNAQQQPSQPAPPIAPQPWSGMGGLSALPSPARNSATPPPSLPPIPIGGGSNGGPGPNDPGQSGPGQGGPGPGDPGAGNPGGGDPGGGGPSGPRIAYSGLAFDNQPSQSRFGFTQLSVGGAPSHALAPIAGPAQAPVGQLAYDLVLAGGGAVNAGGGLDGARLEFNASTIDFVAAVGGDAQLTITGGELTLSYVADAFDYAEVELPFGFGVADPTYSLDGRIEFTLLDEEGTLVSGYWEILGTDRETGLPYNALSVGVDRAGGEFDLAFFLRSTSNVLECGGCSYEALQIGLLFAGWGAPIAAPGAAWALWLGGLWLVRRRRAAA